MFSAMLLNIIKCEVCKAELRMNAYYVHSRKKVEDQSNLGNGVRNVEIVLYEIHYQDDKPIFIFGDTNFYQYTITQATTNEQTQEFFDEPNQNVILRIKKFYKEKTEGQISEDESDEQQDLTQVLYSETQFLNMEPQISEQSISVQEQVVQTTSQIEQPDNIEDVKNLFKELDAAFQINIQQRVQNPQTFTDERTESQKQLEIAKEFKNTVSFEIDCSLKDTQRSIFNKAELNIKENNDLEIIFNLNFYQRELTVEDIYKVQENLFGAPPTDEEKNNLATNFPTIVEKNTLDARLPN